jgi:hypothetical protein
MDRAVIGWDVIQKKENIGKEGHTEETKGRPRSRSESPCVQCRADAEKEGQQARRQLIGG